MKYLLILLVTFHTHGNAKQKLCARYWDDNTTEDIVFGGAKGGGKTYLGVSLIFGDAYTYPGTHHFIARKALNDLRKYTIPSIYEVFNHWELEKWRYRFDANDNVFKLHNDSKVFLLEAKYMPSDPLYQRFGSMQMTRGMIEEAGQFEVSAKTHLSISIGRWKNDKYDLKPKLLQTCNPVKNYLYREYYKPFKDGTLESHKKFIQAFPQDNKRLPKGYIERLMKILDANEIERLIYGNWEYDDDPARLIDYEKILDIFSNTFVNGSERFITADIARQGRDKTVIGVWEGYRIIDFRTMAKNKITEAADEVNRLRNKHLVPLSNTIVDEDGIGGGVKDITGCRGFVNNSRPAKNENYNNFKSQCYFKMAQRINENGYYIDESVISPKDKEHIIEELEQVKKDKVDQDGKQCIIPKDKVKELIGRSPDYSDMLMMRESFNLKRKRLNG